MATNRATLIENGSVVKMIRAWMYEVRMQI